MAATSIKTKVEIQYSDLTITDDQLVSKAKKAYGKKTLRTSTFTLSPRRRWDISL